MACRRPRFRLSGSRHGINVGLRASQAIGLVTMFAGRMPGMRGKVRELLSLIVIVAAVVGAVGWGYSVWRSPHRNDQATYGAYAIALAVLAGSMIAGARRWHANIRRESAPPTTAELDELANRLAEVVKDEWTRAANDRGLLVPEPIPVRWRWPSIAIAGPASVAAGTHWFQPLPGMNAVTAKQLKEGQIRDLHELYGGLGTGRLVIAGAPGSGKSGAAVLLILEALRHREQVAEAARPQVPVPVMFTLHGWNPDAQPVQDWLARRLGQTYPPLAARYGAPRIAMLLATGKIAVILDGLDEIPEELRPVALRALSQQAAFRLVILTRLDEMAAASAKGYLEGAAAVELQDIDAATAAKYLTRVQLDPPPPGWNELTDRLRQAPDAPIAKALSTPLTLTLIRDTYREGDSVRELLHFRAPDGSTTSREAIVDHLLDRGVGAGVVGGLVVGVVAGVLAGVVGGIGRGGDIPQRIELAGWSEMINPGGLAFGVVAGVVAGVVFGVVFGAVAGVVAGVVFGVVFGLMVGLVLASGRTGVGRTSSFTPLIAWRNEQKYWLLFGLAFGLSIGLLVGLVAGVVVGLGIRHMAGARAGIGIGAGAGVVIGVVIGVVAGLLAPETWPTSLAFVQLARRWHTPVRLMRLLEDAHQRSVLRTIGPVYQFRHARLQDRLAEQGSAGRSPYN